MGRVSRFVICLAGADGKTLCWTTGDVLGIYGAGAPSRGPEGIFDGKGLSNSVGCGGNLVA